MQNNPMQNNQMPDNTDKQITSALDNLFIAGLGKAEQARHDMKYEQPPLNPELQEAIGLTDKIIFHALNGSRSEMHLAICEFRFRFPQTKPDPDADIVSEDI